MSLLNALLAVDMPGSSELSDALNPNFFSGKRKSRNTVNVGSDGERLTEERDPTQEEHFRNDDNGTVASSPEISPVLTARPRQDPAEFLRTLLSSFAEYKRKLDAEIEHRRIWEQDEETKRLLYISQVERKLSEMRRDINDLRHIVEQNIPLVADGQISDLSLQNLSNREAIKPSESPTTDIHRGLDASIAHRQFVQGCSTDVLQKRNRSPSQEKETLRNPKRIDNRHRNIQAAMRCHILKLMHLDDGDSLPPSFDRTNPLGDNEPIRFIWERTSKKHVHNGKMKNRIVLDLLASKDEYPLVPDEEFSRAKADAAFENVFTSLRQKFNQQASGHTAKEEAKAKKSRRSGRKKKKLANRLDVRKDVPEYQHPCFDAAFRLECMSSEESSEDEGYSDASGDETNHAQGNQRALFLRVRYQAWRSARLRRLYQLIDARYEEEYTRKPKRGSGRMDRRTGLPKEGNPAPPLGILKWMVSNKWQREVRASGTQLASVLDTILKENDEETLNAIAVLGPDSDSENGLSSKLPHQQTLATEESPAQQSPHSSVAIPASAFATQHLINGEQYWNRGLYLPRYSNGPEGPL